MNIQVTTHPPVSLQFEIPNVLADFIREQTTVGGFKSEGDYLLDLVERDRIRAAKEQLEMDLLKAMNSGPGIDAREYVRKKREELSRCIESGEFPP